MGPPAIPLKAKPSLDAQFGTWKLARILISHHNFSLNLGKRKRRARDANGFLHDDPKRQSRLATLASRFYTFLLSLGVYSTAWNVANFYGEFAA
ncbi:hypothetical protein VTP01DRAFT_1688 [Rhizomucor pusillus]|uniref:uncharacterized protein n=1 Tax=Rhizomucor pusillus TaxID=4840 RepID=UPI00374217B3